MRNPLLEKSILATLKAVGPAGLRTQTLGNHVEVAMDRRLVAEDLSASLGVLKDLGYVSARNDACRGEVWWLTAAGENIASGV